VAADFNSDGKPDIASAGADDVELRLNDGTGWFGAPSNFSAGASPGGLAAGDFNAVGDATFTEGDAGDSDAE
jgi:hypothetical protein